MKDLWHVVPFLAINKWTTCSGKLSMKEIQVHLRLTAHFAKYAEQQFTSIHSIIGWRVTTWAFCVYSS